MMNKKLKGKDEGETISTLKVDGRKRSVSELISEHGLAISRIMRQNRSKRLYRLPGYLTISIKTLP